MDNQGRGVSLKKQSPESWTDPATGEIYPGGNPNVVYPQQVIPQQVTNAVNSTENYSNNTVAGPYVQPVQTMPTERQQGMKFCKFCGQQIPMEAVLCVKCGRQVEQLQGVQNGGQQVFINNAMTNVNQTGVYRTGAPKDKWVAFVLAFFLGFLGVHRFYEGRIGTGILWMLTGGLFGIGWFVDWIVILTKPNPYYV